MEVIVHKREKKDILAYHGWRGPVREAHTLARPNVPYWEEFDRLVNMAFRESVVERADVKSTLDKYVALLTKAKAAKGAR